MNNQIYIHYGDSIFHPEAIGYDHNDAWRNKPNNALWASPIDAEYGWRDFCKENRLYLEDLDEWFTFKLKPWAKVLYIDSLEKEKRLPVRYIDRYKSVYDFDSLKRLGYDAIEINISKCPPLYHVMYTWDCDCIAVLNPGVIMVLRGGVEIPKNIQSI